MQEDFLVQLQKQSSPILIPKDVAQLIHTDSRTFRAGQWFMPIIGANFDGHNYIQEVIDKGAAGFFYNHDRKDSVPEKVLSKGVAVEDTTLALQKLARSWRLQLADLKVVGITGSSGKTTLKELCALMLQKFGPTLKTEGSLNNELGVPLTLCRLTAQHRFAVIEMGARHIGDISFLSHIVEQNIGVLANVGTAHIGEFGGAENILKAKMEIAHASTCIYLRDDERIHKAMTAIPGKRLVSFGSHPEATIRLLDQRYLDTGGLHLRLQVEGLILEHSFPYVHDSFPVNVLCAIAVAKGLDLDIPSALGSLASFSGLKGRFQVHEVGGITLIDDAYNANPNSMIAGLETVRRAYSARRKLIILGDMNELGDSSEESHKQIGRFCSQHFPEDRLFTVGKQAQWIAEAANTSGMNPQRIEAFSDVDALLKVLKEKIKDSELLYVKASNSLKLNRIVETLLLG